MTLNEFKAWFDGYTEDITGPPTEAQWEKIKAKLAATQKSADVVRAVHGVNSLGPNAALLGVNQYANMPQKA